MNAALDTHTQRLLERKRELSNEADLNEAQRTELEKINAELQTYGFRYEVRDPELKKALQLSDREYRQKSLEEEGADDAAKAQRLVQRALKSTEE